jgi:hypothetical protein
MLSLTLLVGIWSTTCMQMQTNMNQGFARESYSISAAGEFEFKREWFVDGVCSASREVEVQEGTLEIGNRLSGMFISGPTYEANFTEENGTDLGAIMLNTKSLKVARGMKNSTMRNTMVGIFEYIKQ